MKTKFIVIYLLAALLSIVAPTNVSAEAIRYSSSAERLRLVIDITEQTTWQEAKANGGIILTVKGYTNPITPAKVPDKALKNLIISGKTGNQQITINFADTKAAYKVFALKGPQRIVVDIYKGLSSKEKQDILRSVAYTSWRDQLDGQPVWLHIVRVNSLKEYKVEPLLAGGVLLGRKTVEQIVRENKLAGGINASYFEPNGCIVGNTKIDGQIISSDNMKRTALAISAKKGFKILTTSYQGQVILPDRQIIPISAVNRERLGDELILYNHFYSDSTHTNEYGLEVIIRNGQVYDMIQGGNTPLQKGDVVLSAHGTMQQQLEYLRIGDKVTIKQTLGNEADAYEHIIGAGPLLVKNRTIKVTSQEEVFPADIARGKAPRSAVGISADGNIFFVVIDGRSAASGGATLTQLATYMKNLGAVEAMNFDGGGSSTIVVADKVLNSPSDGRQRAVASILGISRK